MQEKDISKIQVNSSGLVAFGSNCVRLSLGEWLIVGIFVLSLFYFGPRLWQRVEKFEPGPDYRLPNELSNDYWLYNRYCRWACTKYDTLVIGDSVIWGHFVPKQNTLSHYLNEISGQERFANLGVDGIHPAALAGLLRYYGRDISGKKVILHFNPLWMSSKKHDLQDEKEFHFNHPGLVPQFIPVIPCYKVSYSRRISAMVERYLQVFSWASHLKIAYFENMDLPTWTMEHPYENPLDVTFNISAPKHHNQKENIPWTNRTVTKRDFQWIEPDRSLQWMFFQQAIEILKARDNDVFVLVGPFNEHMMKGESISTYQKIKSQIENWFQQNDIPYYMPSALPSGFYIDASHPLSDGYALLAKQLIENQSFNSNVLQP